MLPIEETTSSGWQSGKSIVDCNRYMLTNKIACDVTFLVGESRQELKAHKYVLISRSSVFEYLFCDPSADCTDMTLVPDIEPDIFKMLLWYIYSGECSISMETVFALWHASNKYGVADLQDTCSVYINSNITVHNSCTVLKHADNMKNITIIRRCLEIISVHAEVCLQSNAFCALNESCVEAITARDDLLIDELKLWEYLVKWAKAQCANKHMDSSGEGLRKVMGKILYSVRFTVMSQKQFAENVSIVNILTEKEKVELFQHFSGLTSCHTKLSLLAHRKPMPMVRICRFSMEGNHKMRASQWRHEGKSDGLSFKVSEDIVIFGIIIYRCRIKEKTQKVVVNIINENGMELVTAFTTVQFSEQQHTMDIIFDKQIVMYKNVFYTITTKTEGPCSYWGVAGRNTVFEHAVQFEFRNSEQSTNGTDLSEGQIPGIIYRINV